MKKLLVLPVLALFLISFQANAQSNNKEVQKEVTSKDVKTVTLKLTGITCAGCSNAIYNALKEVDGVLEHSVEYPGDIAVIEFDDSKTSIKALKLIIEEKGFKAEVVKNKV
ncbi:heavy-metal-associated domain-containing protein [Croceitalea marina]|uniref:Heavy-metal-associated domain-containing protein n=1 Tax=Croceitalea marina TaxID=1775166 RepID=A0ABW5N0B7_9FLAO|nr:heavy-metal-associated domain-containing protein [Maribacter sp. 4G9]PIB38666.1 hypothetical protein BFP75_15435 [Maribacter sp. 4G9]